ncbi:MAG: hypothetical protein GXC94_21260, partial [Comamonadaceae bacterium]|nr:hypothetical protein [Comamonadaceae bacterium]
MKKVLAPALAAVLGVGLWWALRDEAAVVPPPQAPVAALPLPAVAPAVSAASGAAAASAAADG